jgi:putative ABC transport system permease protein
LGNVIVTAGGENYREENIMGTDENFFELFDFPFLYGSASQVLSQPQAVVLTKSTAEKYFGELNPLGEEIIMKGGYGRWGEQGYDDRLSFQVAGVIEDLPENTHLKFDMLVSLNIYTNKEGELSNWGDSFYTYVKVDTAADPAELSAQLPQIIEKYSPDQGIRLSLQPMQKIHLSSQLVDEIKDNGDEKVLWLLSAVAALILLLACTNYINFALAKALIRQKEVGIRKVFWANSQQLFSQLFTEAFFINILALLLALTLIQLASRPVAMFFGNSSLTVLAGPTTWLTIGVILLLTTLISGLYPAIYLSRLRPHFLKKVRAAEALSTLSLRKGLVGFQFVISMLTVGCALVLYGQMNFMQTKDLGMDMEDTLVIRGAEQGRQEDSVFLERTKSFQSELKRLSLVDAVSQANFIPGKEIRGQALGYVRRTGEPEENASSYYFTQLDAHFMEQMNLKFLAGKGFNPGSTDHASTIIINQEACRQLGFTSPGQAIGQQIIYRMDTRPTIIGVVEDFHQLSLQRAYQPIIFEAKNTPKAYYYVKLHEEAKLPEIQHINRLWQKLFPDSPFSYFFLDDFYARQYLKDERFSLLFTAFASLAILIASLGFFGLNYYAATRKIKEIGIRKTLGASFSDILSLLGRGSLSYLIISAVIALPLIVFFSRQWLANYAFRTEIAWWMLVIPPTLMLGVSLLVVVHQSLRTHRLNPVDSLKVE